MAKGNGVIIPGCLVGLLFMGLLGYGRTLEKTDKNTKEITKLDEQHKEDIKDINGKLDTLVNLVHKQVTEQSNFNGKVITTLEFIKSDISEIKDNGQ